MGVVMGEAKRVSSCMKIMEFQFEDYICDVKTEPTKSSYKHLNFMRNFTLQGCTTEYFIVMPKKCTWASVFLTCYTDHKTVPVPLFLLQGSSKFDELFQFLCLCSPFGSPLEIDVPSMSCVLQSSKASKISPAPRVKVCWCNHIQSLFTLSITSYFQKAAWQAGVYKGASKLAVNISEEIKAVLYDKKDVSDVCEVNGIVQCKVNVSCVHILCPRPLLL